MKKILLFSFAACLSVACFSQSVGIGTTTPDASAILDITNTSKGLLIPRMATAAITAIGSPARGLMVYDSTLNQLMVNMGTAATPNWQTIAAGSGWSLTGNSGTNPVTNFLGTKDGVPLVFKVNNVQAAYIDAGDNYTFNTSFGYKALINNNGGLGNTANGYQSLLSNTTGLNNTATGYASLESNTSGFENTANGSYALGINTSGYDNTANGFLTLASNTTGNNNTANGYQSLQSNTTGSVNTANGYQSLLFNNTGNNNTANGAYSLYANTAGYENTAEGYNALYANTTGIDNTVTGAYALARTTAANFNTIMGSYAGYNYDLSYGNTFIGSHSDASFAGAFNDIAIGFGAACTDNSQARIGNVSTSSIGGYANWTNISDGRYKKNLRENVQGLAFIMKLRPVTYNLDITGLGNKLKEGRGKEMNAAMKTAMAEKEQIIQTGFVAQEVEQAAKATGYDFSGVDKPKTDAGLYGLRYSEFVVPLVKAVQEQQQMIELLKQQNAVLVKRVETLEKQNQKP